MPGTASSGDDPGRVDYGGVPGTPFAGDYPGRVELDEVPATRATTTATTLRQQQTSRGNVARMRQGGAERMAPGAQRARRRQVGSAVRRQAIAEPGGALRRRTPEGSLPT